MYACLCEGACKVRMYACMYVYVPFVCVHVSMYERLCECRVNAGLYE